MEELMRLGEELARAERARMASPHKRLPVGINHIRKRARVLHESGAIRYSEAQDDTHAADHPRAIRCSEVQDDTADYPRELELVNLGAPYTLEPSRCAAVPDLLCTIGSCRCADRADVCIWRPMGPSVDVYLARAHALNPRMPQDEALEALFNAENDASRACQRVLEGVAQHKVVRVVGDGAIDPQRVLRRLSK